MDTASSLEEADHRKPHIEEEAAGPTEGVGLMAMGLAGLEEVEETRFSI